ncbi:DoxX family protein [Compostimonas suwonensis]|uniref:DoxX-like protein n=1 Tax=Compostimonas suwonensis TaxID=1048394 RepID=A0A2M9C4S7_9MICO|nr:DoxX family protein [Compostimonas suwonensis]PJJ65534.1 DoxX-like protein [Compostimonas suwonensis]
MLIAAWIVTALLALVFLGSGGAKAFIAKPRLQSQMGWVNDYSATSVKAIGILEIIGAFGLVLPVATGIAPILTPIAALALVVIMIGATVVHARRGETALAISNSVLVLLLLFAAAAWLFWV